MLQRAISLPSAIAIVIANMIGTGVFTSVGFQIAAVPSAFPVLMLWVVGGVIALCGALSYAELVSLFPRSGGEYNLLRESYHPLVGFLAGWVSMIAGFAAPIAITAIAFAKYVNGLGFQVEPRALAASLIVLVAAVHLGNLRLIGAFLTSTTGAKILLILVFILGAVFLASGHTQPIGPKPGDLAQMGTPAWATSLIYVMYAYTGWNGAAYVAGEIDRPQRNVPLALALGTLIVMALYVGLNAVFLWRAPWDLMANREEAGLIAAGAVFGPSGGRFMGILIALGLVSTLAGMTWAGSRVNQRLGQDMRVFRWMAGANRLGAPQVAVLTQAGVALVMLFSGTFDEVLVYVECLLLTSSLLTVAAVIWLRMRMPEARRPFRVPLYPWTPLVFIAMTIYTLVFMALKRPQETAWGLATLAIGALIYLLEQRRNR